MELLSSQIRKFETACSTSASLDEMAVTTASPAALVSGHKVA
jgi:hypothetical protein